MSLINKIKEDMINAKKAGDKVKGSLLNTLYAEAVAVGKNKGNRLPTDEETTAVIKKFLKGVEETANVMKDFAVGEDKTILMDGKIIRWYEYEKIILESYLPKQLVREELEDIIAAQHRAGKNMGEIMKYLKENYAGLYDGKTASEIAKSL